MLNLLTHGYKIAFLKQKYYKVQIKTAFPKRPPHNIIFCYHSRAMKKNYSNLFHFTMNHIHWSNITQTKNEKNKNLIQNKGLTNAMHNQKIKKPKRMTFHKRQPQNRCTPVCRQHKNQYVSTDHPYPSINVNPQTQWIINQMNTLYLDYNKTVNTSGNNI